MDLNYIDVFAGCGGLSLGLHRAGWRGLFAVEKDEFAFSTLKSNFLDDGARYTYHWPAWLQQRPWSVKELIEQHSEELAELKGKIDLLAGGPPCQGFSTAGRRVADDPRNSLVDEYLRMVEILEPRFLIIENVRGFTVDFAPSARNLVKQENSASVLIRKLSQDYEVTSSILAARDFGVPQNRERFVVVAVRKVAGVKPFDIRGLKQSAKAVTSKWMIPERNSSRAAISDFEAGYATVCDCADSVGFMSIKPGGPRTKYQRAMRDGYKGDALDSRLARHSLPIRARFKKIISLCRAGGRSHKALPAEIRAALGMKKMATRVLDPDMPSPTITSMPEDLLHYLEPRTLTVRENARLQSFPDWFKFEGKYTTGGHLRRMEVPRFTQVANAVPPLMAEAIGHFVINYSMAKPNNS